MKYHCIVFKKLLFFTVIMLFSIPALAGSPIISMPKFLATAFQDDTLIFQNEKISFLKNSSSNTPFLNEIELRMKIDQFESDKQEYAVRFKPNGWGEAEHGKAVYHKTLQYNESFYDMLLNEALKKRYEIIIDDIHNQRMIALYEELMVLYEDRVHVLKQSVDDLNFNPNDLIDAENDVIGLELDLINLKNRVVNIEDEILKNVPGAKAGQFDTNGMMDIAGMARMISVTRSIKDENIHLKNSRLDADLAAARYELEKSESRKYISFIEAAYDTDDRDDFEKAFSVQLGFSIPFVNPNRLDTNRRKLSSLKAQSEYMTLQKEIMEDITILSRGVNRLIAQYNVLMAKKAGSKTQSSFDMYRQMEGASPLILLKLKESLLKNDISMEKITYQIYEKYLKYLDVSGKLSERPLKNYLSHNLETINP